MHPEKHLEIENRFLLKPNMDAIRQLPSVLIQQVYLISGPHPENVSRIRIKGKQKAEITRKSGTTGVVRAESVAEPVDLGLAIDLYNHSQYRIEKTRYQYQGWEIDVFHDQHQGLILAEYERRSMNETIPAFPAHLGELGPDVTGEVSNFMLASMNHPSLERTCKRVVFTGGPCSGKSTAVRRIREEFGAKIHCVDEVATTVMDMAKIYPFGKGADNSNSRNFQKTIAAVQRALEDGADFDAASNGRGVVLLDRGIADGGAYVSGMHELESIIGMNRFSVYARYDLVVYFAMPPKDIFEQFSKNNPKRYEKDYAEACERGNRSADAWSGHPKLMVVNDAASWEEKFQQALGFLKPYM